MHAQIDRLQTCLDLGPVRSLVFRRVVFLVDVAHFWTWPAPRPCKLVVLLRRNEHFHNIGLLT